MFYNIQKTYKDWMWSLFMKNELIKTEIIVKDMPIGVIRIDKT